MLNLASRARPYFGAVVLTTALLTAGGIYCTFQIPSGVYPEVTFPRIAVVAKSPGLDLVTTELLITRPLELEASSVLGVRRVRSTTIRGGCDLSIDFAPGTDMVNALHLASERLARVTLPAGTGLTVEQMTPAVFPIISVVLTGGESPAQLRDYAFYELAPQIKTIPDVLYANVAGGDLREIEVIARPAALLAADMSAADLADQIGRGHRLQPVGRIEESPLAFQVLVNTQAEKAREIEELVISTKNGQPLRVRDVADVKVLHADRVSSVGFEGRDAVVVTIFRQPSEPGSRRAGNTLNISHDVQELLQRQPPPRNIRATVAYDQASFVRTAVDNVRDAIVIGSVFSILILLLFLRSWRATLISALAIPTTLAITCLILYWMGATFNLMSLGGLAVAIGLIIDDTVVVIENIARHLTPKAHGAPTVGLHHPVDAASSEITGAVVGSTLTTVIVFAPLALIAGVYGQFFASLSVALAVAVLVSMVISLTLVPVAAAKFLAGRPMPEPGRLYNFFVDRYEKLFETSLRFPWATLMVSFAAIAFGVLLFTGISDWRAKQEPGKPPPEPLVKGVETGLMPAMDEGCFTVDYFAPMGTPLKRTEEMAKTLEEILLENPDVDRYVRRSGTQMGVFATKTNRGDIQVSLRPAEDDVWSVLTKPVRPPLDKIPEELKRQGKEAIRRAYRRRPMAKVMKELEEEIGEHFTEHQLKTELVPIMQDQLNDLSGQNRPLEIKLFGPDYAVLRPLAEKVAGMLEEKGKGRGVHEVNSHVFEGNPDLMVQVNGYWTARGLTAQEVERQLRTIYLGQIATQVRESALRITDVRVRFPDALRFGDGRFDPDLVLRQPILLPPGTTNPSSPTALGALPGLARMVPVAAVAHLERLRTPDEQVRENQQPVVIVTAEQNEEEAGLGSVVADIRRWMAEVPMPPGYHWELGGHYLQQQAAFRSLTVVMVVAVLLVYTMLAFQFRSVVLPLLIFLEQPLSLVSGLFALWITNTPLNVSSYMGAILLIGLDMKNGILLVEYIQQLLHDGMELRQALLVAGRVRFRPILMTSLAAILGLFPLALGIGPGAQMQQPLAIMVMGGLIANMLFTRMVIRAGYLLLERRHARKDDKAMGLQPS